MIPEELALEIRKLAHDLSNALEIIVQTSYLLSTADLKEPASDWLGMLDSGVTKALDINQACAHTSSAHPALTPSLLRLLPPPSRSLLCRTSQALPRRSFFAAAFIALTLPLAARRHARGKPRRQPRRYAADSSFFSFAWCVSSSFSI